jgi:hypothetical protein
MRNKLVQADRTTYDKIAQWAKKNAPSFKDEDGWYNDCDMYDSCMYDLGLDENYKIGLHRDIVQYVCDDYMAQH